MNILTTFAKAESRIAYFEALLAQKRSNPLIELTENYLDNQTCNSTLDIQSLREKAEAPHFLKSDEQKIHDLVFALDMAAQATHSTYLTA